MSNPKSPPKPEPTHLELKEIYQRAERLYPNDLCPPAELISDLGTALLAYMQSEDFHRDPDREYIGPRLLHFYKYLSRLTNFWEQERA